MTSTLITSEIQKLAPSAVMEMFEVDLTELGGTIYRFHAGSNGLSEALVWQGETYSAWPCTASGFDYSTNGQLPRPKISLANAMGTITALILAHDDMVGGKVTRKRTLARYLDAVNFDGGVNPDADDTAEFPDDIFYIDRKVTENKLVCEFELTSAFDVTGIKLPRRQIIQGLCPFLYRGGECGYVGTDYFKVDDSSTTDSSLDVCGKRLNSCKLRFGATSELPFGGFPGAGLIEG
ncbi:MAG: phage minor tail protein L [Alphaproteobacteria bacterium]|jgi:lambda family phage minor tail protein L|nr:phage minor tail protein L [Alphaproteobacteria bacterium]